MKKVLTLILISVFCLGIFILFFPINLIQDKLIKIINTDFNINLKVEEPVDFKLYRPGQIRIKNLSFENQNVKVDLESLFLDLDIQSLFSPDIVVNDFDVKISTIRYKKDGGGKSSSTTNTDEKDKSNTALKSVLIKRTNFKVAQLLLPEYKILDTELVFETFKTSLSPVSLSGKIKYSLLGDLVKGKAILSNKEKSSFRISTEVKSIEEVLKVLNVTHMNIYGDIDFQVTGSLENANDLLSNDIDATFKSQKLKWVGKDLDKVLSAYIDSKKVGILDTAGYLALGPIGILVAKGADLAQAGLSGVREGETRFKSVNIDLNLRNKKVILEDILIASEGHRISAKGQLDLSQKVFNNFSVGTVDDKGCSIFIQKISGEFSNPEIGPLDTFIGEMFSSVKDLFQKGKALISDDCDHYYRGKVNLK